MRNGLLIMNLTFFYHNSVPIRVLLLGVVVSFGFSNPGLSDA